MEAFLGKLLVWHPEPSAPSQASARRCCPNAPTRPCYLEGQGDSLRNEKEWIL